jgi:general secretion pathway protein J
VSGRARTTGMSLIEVMIAITILAMISTLVYSGFTTTARHKARIEQELDRSHLVSAALERMVRELSMAYVSQQTNASNQNGVGTVLTTFLGKDQGTRDRLDFTAFAHQRLYRNAHESDQCEISYFVTPHPDDGQRLVLARREQNRIDDRPDRGGRVEILLDDVKGIDFEYLDPMTVEWVRTWDAIGAAGQPNRLPMQVRIVLSLPDPRRPARTIKIGTRASIALQWGLNHSTYRP